MSWTRKLLVVMIAMLLVGTACAGDDDGAAQQDGEAEGGEPIEVASVHVGAEQENFRAVLDAFQEETGIEAGFRSAGDDMAAFLGTQIEGGSPPDVAMIAQPALIDQLAGDGSLIELNDDVVAAIDENFSAAWRDFGSVEGTPYALYFKVSNKSAWWYNVPVFEQAGVQPPETWEELLQTAETVNASGVPFLSVGGAAGWTLTDMFENIYIRTAGADAYDQLTNHEIPWTDETVTEALETWGQLVSDEANIAGGADGALQTEFEESVPQVWADPPAAATVYEADFVAGLILGETEAQPGEDFDVFPFPSVNDSPPAVVAGGDGAVVLTDNPSAQRFVEYLAAPEAAEVWADLGGFVSANQNLDPSAYPDDITREIATAVVEAGDEVRFDMSDLAPPAFGGTTGQGLWKLFQDFLKDPSNVDAIQRQLEQAAGQAYGG
jgi:ABC-type glycerol-3-phosphate transport system substrate-binding protein